MIKNFFKTALRNISRNKLSSFVNTAGLSVGMAVAIRKVLGASILRCADHHFDHSKFSIYKSGDDEPGEEFKD